MVWGAALGLIGQAGTAAANVHIAREQMRFQERMSNTAYQRTMEDMRKAGLNPMLAAKLGGASTPPGASIPVTGDLSKEFTSARQRGKMKEETEKTRIEKGVARANQINITNQGILNAQLAANAAEEFKTKQNTARKTSAEAAMAEAAVPYALLQAEVNASDMARRALVSEKWATTLRPWLAAGGAIAGGLGLRSFLGRGGPGRGQVRQRQQGPGPRGRGAERPGLRPETKAERRARRRRELERHRRQFSPGNNPAWRGY